MSKEPQSDNPVYHKNTIEFVTVSKSFCDFLDQLESVDKKQFLDTMTRLLPLLYLKASLLPQNEMISDDSPETFATEEQYAVLSQTVSDLLGTDDAYLEVFHPDIKYTDTPVVAFISENIADIWQDLFDFLSVFRLGYDETMNDALYVCRTNFEQIWGQSLVNVLRALHHCKYAKQGEEEEGATF
ncbi:MAG: DUF5063 domain-containing protein [Bacteroidales bacterium]|jgi:hypothetical protein|nr:DUF5063 domain-containing protein [Bacteroidales bacterium]MEA4840958.1 DUF5063 domain-containing protein [Bacteroidales bacterium]